MKLNLKSNVQGLWGNPTAGIDWCEPNYTHSYYIAELFNTISNSFYLICAFLMYKQLQHLYASVDRKLIMFRFYVAAAGMALVGVGSWLFHMTLLATWQAADELAMNIYILTLVFCVLMRSDFKDEVTDRLNIERLPDSPEKTRQEAFHVVLTAFGYFASLKSMLTAVGMVMTFGMLLRVYDSQHPLSFQVPFGIMFFSTVGYTLYYILLCSRQFMKEQNKATVLLHEKNKRYLLLLGSVFAALSIFVWNVDNITCPNLESLKLHSVWHLFTAITCWYWNFLIVYCVHVDRSDEWEYESLKKESERAVWFAKSEKPLNIELELLFGVIPHLKQSKVKTN